MTDALRILFEQVDEVPDWSTKPARSSSFVETLIEEFWASGFPLVKANHPTQVAIESTAQAEVYATALRGSLTRLVRAGLIPSDSVKVMVRHRNVYLSRPALIPTANVMTLGDPTKLIAYTRVCEDWGVAVDSVAALMKELPSEMKVELYGALRHAGVPAPDAFEHVRLNRAWKRTMMLIARVEMAVQREELLNKQGDDSACGA